MIPQPLAVHPDTRVLEVLKIVKDKKIDAVPIITDDNKLIGLFTKSSLCNFALSGSSVDDPLKGWIETDIQTISPEATLKEAWQKQVDWLPVVNKDGTLAGFLTRAALAKTLYESSKESAINFRLIFDSTYNGIVVTNKKGLVTLINRPALKFIGLQKDEVINQHIDSIIQNTGMVKTLNTGEVAYGEKFIFGDSVFLANRAPIFRSGEIVGSVCVFHEMSEFCNYLDEIQHLSNINKELDVVIETCHDAIVVVDGSGYVHRVNPAYEKMSGVRANEVVGKNMYELQKKGFASEAISLRVLAEKKPCTVMQKYKTGRKILFTGSPIFDETGKIVKVIATGRDMTELHKLQAELEKVMLQTSKYHKEIEELRIQQANFKDIVFASPKMRIVFNLVLKIARVDSTVLLLGESGVGKEVFAKLLHYTSPRQNGSLVKINCAAIPENLLESELFGYESGSFSGAKKGGKIGLFEAADNGTILLDEIGELPTNLQAKLLRVLQEEEITRIGGTKSIKVNVRVIAATNQSLENLVVQGRFREDLFYRLNVVPISIPPLRERKEDIIPLIFYFLEKYNNKYQMNKKLPNSIVDKLLEYSWPGNVRELENVVQRIMVVSNDDKITDDDLPLSVLEDKLNDSLIKINKLVPLREAIAELEKEMIIRALKEKKTVRGAAGILGVNPSTITRKRVYYENNEKTRH